MTIASIEMPALFKNDALMPPPDWIHRVSASTALM
jgi:hypothetical protein